jgi:hypothetical protein
MFSRRRTLHRWAAFVLLLWLFGIGAGVAHACLAPSLAASTTTGVAAADHGAALAPCHGEGLADEGAPLKTNCQDFCDRASVSIPPLKAALDQVLGAALLLTVVTMIAPVPASAPANRLVRRRDGARPAPIAIAYLRLTL